MSAAPKYVRGNGTKNDWSPDRVERLKDLWADGMSCSRIAKLLGPGFTRSAIIGKVHRLGLHGRLKTPPRSRENRPHVFLTGQPQHRVLRKAKPLPQLNTGEPEPLTNPDGSRITLYEACERQCRWISDDATYDAAICGHETVPGRSYCLHHLRRCISVVATRHAKESATDRQSDRSAA